MFSISLIVALVAFVFASDKPSIIKNVNCHTIISLFAMLLVLSGFKRENIFSPIIKVFSNIRNLPLLSLFLIMCVFFSSMLVTNDIALIFFVPLTIEIFKKSDKDNFLLPVLILENIAAIRGSLLTPFGSPQNLYFFNNTSINAFDFIKHMSPLCIMSFLLICLYVLFIFRRNLKEKIIIDLEFPNISSKLNKKQISYIALFICVVLAIVLRLESYPFYIVVLLISIICFLIDKEIFKSVDYFLLLTFFCFFFFSNCICQNVTIANFLRNSINGREYIWVILLSQIISNVPATIILFPFCDGKYSLLIYASDTAGLLFILGSLANIIILRLYKKEFAHNIKKYILAFLKYSTTFFAIVVIPGFLIAENWQFI